MCEIQMNHIGSGRETNASALDSSSQILLRTINDSSSNSEERILSPERVLSEDDAKNHLRDSVDPTETRWFHIWENDAKVIEKWIRALDGTERDPTESPSTRDGLNGSWPSYERPVNSVPSNIILPHSRFMEPACRFISNKSNEGGGGAGAAGAMCAFLPYLNWENFSHVRDLHKQQESLNERSADGHYYHHRRTLDQFYYSGLADQKRDAQQTISRWTGEKKDSRNNEVPIPEDGWPEPVGDSRLVMVDQLWLFVVNPNCILTFFPSHGVGEPCTNLYDEIRKEAHYCKNAYDLAALVIGQTITLLLDSHDQRSADIFGIYQWAIGNKAAKQIKCFEDLAPDGPSMASDTNKKELKLILEVADVLDELNMISNLLSKQEDVCMLLQKTLSEWLPARHQNQKHVHLEIEQQLLGEANLNLGAFSSGFIKVKQPERGMLNVVMDKNDVSIREQLRIGGKGGASFERSRFQLRHAIQTVERLQMAAKNTHELLLSLLNLKQTAAGLEESRAATKQGRAVMLFTIVTIIFLPLSFFTSWFGQNVSKYTGDDKNPTLAHLWKIGGPISAVIIILALIMAYCIGYPESRLWPKLGRRSQRDGHADGGV